MLVLLLGGWGFSSAVCISDSVKAVDTDQSQQGEIQAQDSCCILPNLGCGQKLYRKPLVGTMDTCLSSAASGGDA